MHRARKDLVLKSKRGWGLHKLTCNCSHWFQEGKGGRWRWLGRELEGEWKGKGKGRRREGEEKERGGGKGGGREGKWHSLMCRKPKIAVMQAGKPICEDFTVLWPNSGRLVLPLVPCHSEAKRRMPLFLWMHHAHVSWHTPSLHSVWPIHNLLAVPACWRADWDAFGEVLFSFTAWKGIPGPHK